MLAEYDQAAWHATDAVFAKHPQGDNTSRFLCRQENKSWTCVLGRLAADKFLVDYEAVQGARPEEFQVKHYNLR
jgi:hypothetical protein